MNEIRNFFNQDALLKQARKVQKKSSHGIDGVPATQAVQVVNYNHHEITEQIINGKYKPAPIIKVEITKANGKKRTIGNAITRDRIIQGCIAEYINSCLDSIMSDNSFGFRPERNCQMAISNIIRVIEDGYSWIISLDLKDCFNHIDHDRILWLLGQYNIDGNIIKDINNIINNKYISKDGLTEVSGCPQGSNVSPVLCNLILNELDKELEHRGHPFTRYADDIYILCKSEKSANRTLISIIGYIETELKLKVNQEKTKVISVQDNNWSCLGFTMYYRNQEIHLYAKESKVQDVRNKIADIMKDTRTDEVVKEINMVTTGWINYFAIAEIGSVTKNMDAFIKRQLSRLERNKGIRINRNNLVCCHDYYKRMEHQQANKSNMPEKDGRRESNTTTQNHENKKDTAVSFWVRAPPLSSICK